MKTLHSLPSDKSFFDIYSKLAKSVRSAGFFAQLVSALTEVGIIYTGTYQSLAPLHLDHWGMFIALLVAMVATAVIEIGLRQTFPKAIDSVLYKRWSGLHLPISVFVWLLAIVLMGASGWLSFSNSKVIVEDFTPEAEQVTTTVADSTYQSETAGFRNTFVQDSTMIEGTYQSRAVALEAAYTGKIKAKTEKLRGYESREQRTGNSYASAKDRIRQERAELEAEQATQLAELATSRAAELSAAKATYSSSIEEASENRKLATAEVKSENQKAEAERVATVNNYGGGLGWFTIVCLFLFAVSVILDRIYRKGAGIEESIQIEAYDFRPGAISEWWSALSERVSYGLHNRITKFADKTPAAPLPAQPGAVYDIAEALQHLTIKLQLDKNSEEEERVIYLNAKEPGEQEPPKRNKIGFRQSGGNSPENLVDPLYSTKKPRKNHENEVGKTTKCTTNINKGDAFETPELRHAKQQLKKYKKNVGTHKQKAIVQERKNGFVNKRTLDAIENNTNWVNHWETIINNQING